MIIVVGVGIFGTFTGYLANLFLAPRKKAPEPVDTLTQLRHVLDLPGVTVEDVDRVLALRRDGPVTLRSSVSVLPQSWRAASVKPTRV